MPGLDPSIILAGQQQPNALDSMSKAASFQDLMIKNQEAKQQFQDQQAMRQAYANNTSVDENGQVQINRKGMLSDLAQMSPSQVSAQAQNFAQMDYNIQKQKMEMMHGKMDAMGQLLGGVTDQKSYEDALSQMQGLGVDVQKVFPPTYDPSIVKGAQMKALTALQQIEAQAKQQGLDIQGKEADIKAQQLALELKKNSASQVQETLQSLQSARGNPAVQRAEMDLYSNDKVNKLVGDGDPNKLNNTKVRLLAGEVGKIATGGAPTLEELKGLTPGNIPQILADSAEKYKNNPQPANAGAFVKALQAYSNGVADDAKDLLKKNYQGIIESKKPYLNGSDYKALNDQFIGRINGTTPPSDWSAAQEKQAKTSGGSAPKGGVLSFEQWKANQNQKKASNQKGKASGS